MSRFGAIALIAACGVPAKNGTSLAGPTACAAATCGSGQMCMFQFSGVDAGAGTGNETSCIDVPSGCVVYDCSGSDCPTCVTSMCPQFDDDQTLISIAGRTLTCPAE